LLEEDIYFTTPLDTIDPYEKFQSLMAANGELKAYCESLKIDLKSAYANKTN
jgi:hypothetical protein